MEKILGDKIKLLRFVKKISKSSAMLEEMRSENEIIDCKGCGFQALKNEWRKHQYVCPKCGKYKNIAARVRIKYVCDEDSFREFGRWIKGYNPLDFPEYDKKLSDMEKKTDMPEAVVTGTCRIGGYKAVICVMDSRFMMASMGMAVGEKITRAVEYATKKKLPLVIFSASGGARMQEGMLSLMQMAKTSAAIGKLRETGGLFISVMTNPTTGGVTASFASLGDVQIAEPGALIGFAGPRVISQTIGEKLPEGFQSAEFLYEHGLLDGVVPRAEMKGYITRLISLHQKGKRIQLASDKNELAGNIEEELVSRSADERVLIARNEARPTGRDYIDRLISDFCEFGGDRLHAEDVSIVCGVGRFHGISVVVIAQERGKSLDEKISHRFGMPNPEGYRKAERLMKHADRFGLPIITFVDTPGAYPGKEAEENGQGSAIAHCLLTLSRLRVPVVNVFVGEGGSGGALAIGFGDCMIMLENSVFSILSPEGFASILYKDSSRWKEACENMKMTAAELKEMGICDCVIKEDGEGAHEKSEPVFKRLDAAIAENLGRLMKLSGEDIVKQRYRRLRKVGKELI
ncbi:Acetyl-coenzyme A carboxylase carboxyl transferase subunit beta [[Eubacterium] infirmum]|nr:Acetyl-coenzyme A carboxylase carboxyl transferase subunit beta [[Eubacterium] infirmum]